MQGTGPTRRLRVWDLPTRIVHWLLVLLIPGLWWTAQEGMIARHLVLGLTALGLLVFRLIWGFAGSSTARFSSFVRGPRAIADYLAGRSQYRLGHNPLGALSVLAMLGLLSLQVGLGLFATDEDGFNSGPLAYLVSVDASEEITQLHETAFWLLLAVIALHVAAILFYLFGKRDNLLRPMVVGTRDAPDMTEEMRPAGLARFILAAAVAAALTLFVAGLLPG
jgi:cytochrome b